MTTVITGHRALMGDRKNGWQEIEEVLGRFSEKTSRARHHYRRFLEEGMNQGEKPDFEGGGLIRSLRVKEGGSWENRSRDGEVHDERVLGCREFVGKVLTETGSAETDKKVQVPLSELVGRVSECFKVDLEDLYLGCRKREVSSARALVSYLAVHKMGYRFSEVGEALKVHPVSVARSLEKGREVFNGHEDVLGVLR